MSNLSQDIQDAIRKSLPEQTAAELKLYLETAECNAKLVETLRHDFDVCLKRHEEKDKIIAKAGNLETREGMIKGKEAELLARETQIKHREEILNLKDSMATLRHQDAMEMMKVVFKSQPIGYAFSRQVNENGNEPCPSTGYASTVGTNKTKNEYTTKREITE